MNSDKIHKFSEKNDESIQKDASFSHRLNINSLLIDKLKILNKEIKDKSFRINCINLDKKLTTIPKRMPKKFEDSKTNETSKSNEFTKYNFSNLNNIRRIYLRNNNLFSTEIDYKYFNRSYNSFYNKQDKNNKNKCKIGNELEPIYEVFTSSRKNNFKNIYNNYINMTKAKDVRRNKNSHISPEQFLRIKNNKSGKSNFDKFINYFPYIEKIKKIKANKSNDNILLNKIFNNFSNIKRVSFKRNYPAKHCNKNLNISNSPQINQSRNILLTENQSVQKINRIYNKIKERQYRTTHHRPKKNIEDLFNNENKENRKILKQLSFRKYFGDNYKYFERNESPIKDCNNTTFHNRRSPAHVFGYENYFILENSNNRLIVSPWPIISKTRRLNSEENIRKYF